ncbi:MAG: pyrroline-5-carboxylate reductase [Spirochaetota bacterium]
MHGETIAVIGGGNMGGAILVGLVKKNLDPENLLVVEIDSRKRDDIKHTHNIACIEKLNSTIGSYRTIVIAVKPAQVGGILKELSPYICRENLVISVAAGVEISYMEQMLPENTPLVRTMPNIGAQVGAAAVAYCCNKCVSGEDRNKAERIISSIGEPVKVNEKDMNAVTGLSGSGPGFVFLMVEALSEGGVLMGLDPSTARELAVQTLYGCARFLKNTGMQPSQAKQLITSPGGTTIEGLLQLEQGGFKALVMNAVREAARKSEIISSKFSKETPLE